MGGDNPEMGGGPRGGGWDTPMTIADQIARRLIVRRVVPSELKRGAKIEMLAGGSLDSEIEKVILDGRSVTMDANDEFILSRCDTEEADAVFPLNRAPHLRLLLLYFKLERQPCRIVYFRGEKERYKLSFTYIHICSFDIDFLGL